MDIFRDIEYDGIGLVKKNINKNLSDLKNLVGFFILSVFNSTGGVVL